MPHVAVMLLAGNVEYVGSPRAESRGDAPMHLMDVGYKFVPSAPDAEFPLYVERLWLYVRWFLADNELGDAELSEGSLGLRLWSIDDPRGPAAIPLGTKRLKWLRAAPTRNPVTNMAFALDGLEFWRRGRYYFALKFRRNKPDWHGRRWQTVGKSYFEIG